MTLNANGELLVGTTSSNAVGGSAGSALLQVETPNAAASMSIARNTANATGPRFFFGKSRGAAAGGRTIVSSGDSLGEIFFSGTDGTNYINAATITAAVDGTPGTNDMPGRLVFSTSADGSATPTERMRIDSSGNVGIGTTSPATYSAYTKLSVLNGVALAADATNGGVVVGATTSGTELAYLSMGRNYNLANTGEIALATATSKALILGTNGTERARITSDGNLLVGASANPGLSWTSANRLFADQTAADFTCHVRNSSGTAANNYGIAISFGATPNGTGNAFIEARDATAQRFQVRSNGGIANFSGNNVNLSDRREKTNFAPAGDYLSKICAIPVQTFNYIDQNMEEDPGLTLGVVAQEVQDVAPELVMESNWGTAEEPKMRLSIYQTDLQYALMKCIQEQQQMIETLQAKVAALEGKK
jgi:hypothetical protein